MTAPDTRSAATIVASAGVRADPGYGSLTPPLFASDTYEWPDADTKPAFDYSRTVNPNRALLIEALAALEGAAGGAATASGQSAVLLATLLLPSGARVVAPHDCYGGTYRLLKGLETDGKLVTRFIDMADDAAFDAAMAWGPALVWIETPSNPLLRVTDIARRAAAARAAGALVAADNTVMTPCRQRPLDLGCDLVMHSTTKALNGHADLFGGALLAKDPALVERIEWWANAAGLSASAHECWQTLRGLRTLPLRIDRMEASARAVHAWLAQQPGIAALHYPDAGFMLSFELAGDAATFLGALKLITLASSLGGYATLICKPATMTHRGMPPEAQAEAGIAPDLLRLSVGLEAPEDIIADLARGFAALG